MKLNFVWQLLFGTALLASALSASDNEKKHHDDHHNSHHKCEQSSGPKANCHLDLTVAVDMSWAMKSRKNVLNLANFTIDKVIDQYAINYQYSRVAVQTLGSWAFSQSPYFDQFGQVCKFITHAAETFPFFGNDFFQLSKVFQSYLISNILPSPKKRVLVIITAINDPFNINAAILLANLVRKKAHVVVVGINQKNKKYLERIADDVIFTDFNDYSKTLADEIVSKTCPGSGNESTTTTSKPVTTTTTTTLASTTTTTSFVEPTSTATTTESPLESTTGVVQEPTTTVAEPQTTSIAAEATTSLPQDSTTSTSFEQSTTYSPQSSTIEPSDPSTTSGTNEPSTSQPENPSTTEQSPATSAAPSDAPSTLEPENPTTSNSDESSSTAATVTNEPSTLQPENPSTNSPQESTTSTEEPVDSTTAANPSTAEPSDLPSTPTDLPIFTTEASSTSQPQASSTISPDQSSTSFPEEPSTYQPSSDSPIDRTTENPILSSTFAPIIPTTDGSEHSTFVTDDSSTTISQQTSTTTEQSSFTSDQTEGSPTTLSVQPSTPESENPSTEPPIDFTTPSSDDSSTTQPDEPSTASPIDDGSTQEPIFSTTFDFSSTVSTTHEQGETTSFTSTTTQSNDFTTDQPQAPSSTVAPATSQTDEPSTLQPENPSSFAPNTLQTDEPSTAMPQSTSVTEQPNSDSTYEPSTVSSSQPSTSESSNPSTQPGEPSAPTSQIPDDATTNNSENPSTTSPVEPSTSVFPSTEETNKLDASTSEPINPSTDLPIDLTTTSVQPEIKTTSNSVPPINPSSETSPESQQTTEFQPTDATSATTIIQTEITAFPPTTENPLSDALGSACSTNTTGAWLDIVFAIDTSAVLTSTQLNQFGGLIAGLLRRFTIDLTAERSTRAALVTYTKESVVQFDLASFKDWSALFSTFSTIGKFRKNEKVVDISQGLSAADKLLKSQNSHRIPVIVLVTASTNTDSIPAAAALSKQIISEGTKIVTITFAVDHDATEAPLSSLASPNYGFVSNDPQLYSKLTVAFTKVNCVCPKLTYQFSTESTVYGDCVQGFNGQTPPDIAQQVCEMAGGILVSVTSQEKLDFIRTKVVKNVFGANPEFTIGLHRIPENGNKWFWFGYANTTYPLGDFKKWEDGKAPADSAGCGYAAREVSDNALAFAAGGCDYEDARPYLCQTKACDSEHFCDLESGVKAANAHVKLQTEMKQRSFRSSNKRVN